MTYFYQEDGITKNIKVVVHQSKIIIVKNGENHLLEHEEYNEAVDIVRDIVGERCVDNLKINLKANLERFGVIVIYKPDRPTDDNPQFSLF